MSYNKLLKTKTDYNNALKRIDEIFDAKKGPLNLTNWNFLWRSSNFTKKNIFQLKRQTQFP